MINLLQKITSNQNFATSRQRKDTNVHRKKVKECEKQFHSAEAMRAEENSLEQIA